MALQNKSIEKREKIKGTIVLERKRRIKDSLYHPLQIPLVLQRKKDILKKSNV